MSYELYHHGILGQKWGIRRFQNEDGSLTAAGQKRYSSNKDSDRLANTMSRYINAYADHLNSSKTTYFTDDKGNVLRRDDGSERGLFFYDTNKQKKWQEETQKYLREKEMLKKKYADVVANADLTDAGESYIRVQLTDKLGRIFVSELSTTYNADFNKHDYKKMYN